MWFRIRKFCIHVLTLCSYFASVYFLFVSTYFVYAFVALVGLYIFFHFSLIELKHTSKTWHFFLLLFAASTLLYIFLGLEYWYLGFSVYVFHAGLFFLVRYAQDALQNRKKLSLREIFHIGAYIFTVCITLSFGTLILATYPTFPLTCDQLYTNTDEVVSYVLSPFGVQKETVTDISSRVMGLSGLSVGDALGLTGGTFVANTGQDSQSIFSSSNDTRPGILGFLETSKQRLIDQVIADNNTIKMNVCELLVSQITEKYNKPVFQFSLILLLFILLYPFLRVAVFVMEVLGWIVLGVLYLVKGYRFVSVIDDVEDVV